MHPIAQTRQLVAAMAVSVLVSACGATPERAQQSLSARFVGQPVESFFSRYGMPLQTMATSDGGKMYSWRGGQFFVNHPAQVQTVSGAGGGQETTRTTSHTTQTGPGSSKTESTSVTVGIAAAPTTIVTQPATSEELVCEAQITTNARGIITAFNTTRDTRGGEMGLSRCAEVFGVKG